MRDIAHDWLFSRLGTTFKDIDYLTMIIIDTDRVEHHQVLGDKPLHNSVPVQYHEGTHELAGHVGFSLALTICLPRKPFSEITLKAYRSLHVMSDK